MLDELAGIGDTLAFPERGYRFLGRLLSELKRRGVTSLFTLDPQALAAATGSSLWRGLIGWFDNVFEFGADPSGGRSLAMRRSVVPVRTKPASMFLFSNLTAEAKAARKEPET